MISECLEKWMESGTVVPVQYDCAVLIVLVRQNDRDIRWYCIHSKTIRTV
jgi:hypothetical protein